MAKINKNYRKLQAGYLFSEIAKRAKAFAEANPGVEILKLGIGNTTEPLVPSVVAGLLQGVDKLSRTETYTGYGEERGNAALRAATAAWYAQRGVTIDPLEIFVSDGAKSDSANISSIFGQDNVVAIADPVYPVYVDSNVIAGRGGEYKEGRFQEFVYMTCNKENGFFPELPTKHVDLIYICSPNNPTGAVATREQLKKFVDHAIKNKAIIIFDAAYSEYISDPGLPRSIYEIEGADKCAIEIHSLSKTAGFTGVRLGWTIVPFAVTAEDSEPGEINKMWNRRQSTMFNGASNISQEGAMAVLSDQGQREYKEQVRYYMENARIIKNALGEIGLEAYGGENAPYIWVKTPGKLSSWEFFDKLLNECRVVGTPGVGFGPGGEGYLRLSAFNHREEVEKTVKSIKENLKLDI